MKIPMPELPQGRTRPVGENLSNLDFNDGTSTLAAGVGALSKGLEDAGDVNAAIAKRAKAKADDIAADSLFAQAQSFTTDQLHGYDEKQQPKAGAGALNLADPNASGSYGTLTDADILGAGEPGAHVAGFLDTRGTEAYEKAGDVTEALQKKYEALLKAAGNDDQRRIFSQRLDALKASVHTQIASHEGQQRRVAEVAATKGLLDTTLRTASNLYDQPKEVARFVDDALDSLKRSALPEEFEAAKGDYLSKVSQVMIGGYLQHGDVVGAAARYGADEKLLGDDGPAVKARIDAAAKAAQVHAFDVEAQTRLDGIIAASTSPVGKPDLAAIDAAVAALPAGPLRDEMIQRSGPEKERRLRQWKEKVDGYADHAGSTFEKTLNLGAVDPKVKSWLIDNAPDEWKKLRHDAESELDRQRTRRTGDAAARRAQAEVDRLARLEFLELPPAERATADVGAFLRGRGVSPIGASTVKGEQTKSAELVRKGDAVGETEFVRQVEAKTQGLVGADKKDIKAAAVDAYAQLREKAKGKPPSEDVEKEVARLTLNAATKPRSALVTWLPGVDDKGIETGIEKDIREKKATKGKVAEPPPTTKPKLAAGRYADKAGKVWVVDAAGNKRAE